MSGHPLVSILIPAYNAEHLIPETLNSALRQTWPRTEIIVVDDGSRDKTFSVAKGFASSKVSVVTQQNQGAAATRNAAYALAQGDFVQWLDADDLLAADKIERQMEVFAQTSNKRVLFSGAWGNFYHRPHKTVYHPTSLWADLSPVDWLIHKLTEQASMQTAAWLTSRELAEAAGKWDTTMLSDDDGEYYCRVILGAEKICFVPAAKVMYRATASARLSHVGTSARKLEALFLSIKLHIKYILSLEDSPRVRKACHTFLQTAYPLFDPHMPAIAAEMQTMAESFGGERLFVPKLRWKYAWIHSLLGWSAAKWAEAKLPQWKHGLLREWDQVMYKLGR